MRSASVPECRGNEFDRENRALRTSCGACLRGLRYFDLKRWDLGPELLNGQAIGCRDGSVNSTTGEVTWNGNYIILEERKFLPARKYLLPIPQVELDRNENMVQNEGY